MEIAICVILIVLVVALFLISYLKRRNFNQNLTTMRNDLKVGDKVMTDSGIVGELASSYEEDGFKYLVLKTGNNDKTGYVTVHINSVYYVYGKDLEKKEAEKVVVKLNKTTTETEETK